LPASDRTKIRTKIFASRLDPTKQNGIVPTEAIIYAFRGIKMPDECPAIWKE
jgi:hypothetical protein